MGFFSFRILSIVLCLFVLEHRRIRSQLTALPTHCVLVYFWLQSHSYTPDNFWLDFSFCCFFSAAICCVLSEWSSNQGFLLLSSLGVFCTTHPSTWISRRLTSDFDVTLGELMPCRWRKILKWHKCFLSVAHCGWFCNSTYVNSTCLFYSSGECGVDPGSPGDDIAFEMTGANPRVLLWQLKTNHAKPLLYTVTLNASTHVVTYTSGFGGQVGNDKKCMSVSQKQFPCKRTNVRK